jgi:hypothetical protein
MNSIFINNAFQPIVLYAIYIWLIEFERSIPFLQYSYLVEMLHKYLKKYANNFSVWFSGSCYFNDLRNCSLSYKMCSLLIQST